jgi:hypothetical protein
VLDQQGRVLRLGQYWDDIKDEWTGVPNGKFKEELGIGAAAVDWDEDGDLDLLLGSNGGKLYLRVNEGTKEKAAFATESVPLESDGAPLEVAGHELIPSIADWDGDGLFDVLCGSGFGGAFWFRNAGKKGEPKLEPAKELVETHVARRERGAKEPAESSEPTWPGERTQVVAVDYDADGDLDLLVGDFNNQQKVAGDDRAQMHGWVWLFRRR